MELNPNAIPPEFGGVGFIYRPSSYYDILKSSSPRTNAFLHVIKNDVPSCPLSNLW